VRADRRAELPGPPAAFDRDKPVVTANKELLATRGRELFDASDAKGLDLYFEAAVGGGIPLIRPLKESLTGERLRRVMGIVNGTTNFILTKMSEEGRGFAESWPTRSASGTPKPTRAPTSTGTTRRPSARSSPRSPSTLGSSRATFSARASRGSPSRTSSSPGGSATW
jgi:hypothetical protein